MGSSSTLWAKAEQNAGNTVKDLKFDEDLGSSLDDLDKLIDQFLALENKMFRVARRMFTAAKKVRRIADEDSGTIRAKLSSKTGPEKAALATLLTQVDRAVDEIQDSSIDEVSFRIKREVAMARRISRALK